MSNPWGLGGKNPWKKEKKEPSLNKDEKNPWGLTGKKPWGKEETDKERIARLEKEVEDLKNNNKQEQDDSWIDKQGFVSKPKNDGNTWFYKWGQNENSINLKLENAGYGGESIEMSKDGGFIVGTSGSTIIKTDQDLNF